MNDTLLQFLVSTLSSTVSAFTGFLLVMSLQNHTERRLKNQRISLVKLSIKEELNDIVSTLFEYLDIGEQLGYQIQTPSWDAIINAGTIIELIDETFYVHAIKTYSLIKSFNENRFILNKDENLNSLKEIVATSKYIVE
ncbi:MAG: hypothetical protein FWH40_09130 [Coriobacteriia bacterium]|nr:hypothetical protein [Coriobacteriia bacterium]